MNRLLFPHFASLSLWVLGLVIFWGCSCEEEQSAVTQNTSTSPLVDQGVPSRIRIEIYPVLGTISARPVQLVMSRLAMTCPEVRALRKNEAHVLCLPDSFAGSPEDAEAEMKEGLRFLKETYARYVSGSPVHLVTDESWSGLGFQLMLREPRVFGLGYLPSLPPAELSSSTLYALFSGGARALVLGQELPPGHAALTTMAARGGLRVISLPPGPDQLTRAMKFLGDQDPRLAPSRLPAPSTIEQ